MEIPSNSYKKHFTRVGFEVQEGKKEISLHPGRSPLWITVHEMLKFHELPSETAELRVETRGIRLICYMALRNLCIKLGVGLGQVESPYQSL